MSSEPRVDELTTVQAIEAAAIVDRSFRLWWVDHGQLLSVREYRSRTVRPACSAAFRAGFDLARQLFLREDLFPDGPPAASDYWSEWEG